MNSSKNISNDSSDMGVTNDSPRIKVQLTEEYARLSAQRQWEKALPIIERLVEQNPKIGTSWFNYGVCLDALNKHEQAAISFISAYKLNPKDYGAQYRVYRSFALAKDVMGFAEFLKKDIKDVPEIGEILIKTKEFNSMTSNQTINEIISKAHK